MKKLIGALLISMLLLLSACTNGGSEISKVKLTMWTTTSKEETAFFQEQIHAFQVEHPEIQVTLSQRPFPFATHEFKTSILGDQGIDVFRADNSWIPEYAALGILYQLDSIASQEELSCFVPSALNAASYQGHVLGFPSVTEVPALLYNKELLKQAGFTHPPETMDELSVMAKALTVGSQYGIFVTEDSYFALPYLWAFGGGMVTDDRKIEIATAQSQQAFAFMRQLRQDGVTQPYPDFVDWYNKMMKDFQDGKVAMMMNGPWAIHDVLQGKSFTDSANLGIAPIPKGPLGQGSPIGGHSFVINKYSRHPKESYELIRYLTSAETQVKQSRIFKTLPTQKAAYEDPSLASDFIFQGFKQQLESAKSLPKIPENSKLYRDFTPHVHAMLLGKETVQEGVLSIERSWFELLRLKDDPAK
ncbi:extracellular solute-binding protein [Paenibacillus hexagrammi]|uniref:Extracellular solute-binding protein n=1 Tax=Paenibacillus hexagrammi TaxID=2908839 RepID=A0ABY3SPN3_9BACL|nr:extracellular solute-binding protein [Paenibacillus sp. YPD9-1]UJF35495.1 extracellular solute-binding protein [Paenibacillus sp. YPD9-1]